MPLANAKHEAVALAYLTDPEHIGWRAYASVYPKCTQRAAETQWSRLLKNVEFAARISELGTQAADGAVATSQQVLEELTKLALSNMQDFVGEDQILHPVAALDRRHAAAIQEYTVEHYMDGHGDDAREVKKIKLKLASKHQALESLGKHHVLFTEKHVHEFGGVAERLAAALERIGDNHRQRATNADKLRPPDDPPRRRGPRKAARKSRRTRA